MAQNVTFNINLKVDGKDAVQRVTMNVDELRHVIDEAKDASERFASSLINFNQKAERIRTISDSVSQLSSTLNDLTEESRSFGGAMAAANTMAGKSGEELELLKDQVSELSKSVPVARDELANGLYQVISNGVPEDNWISFLSKSARASVGGMADLGETVKVTSTIIKNYGLSWEAAGEIQDKIQLTAKNGVTSFEQMAQALPRVASQASNLGVGVDELMASFATLTGVSGNTAEVSTQLAAIFTALIKPSSEATEMAKQMGIQFDAAAIKAAGGMSNFIAQLDKDVKSYAQSSGMLEQEIYGKLFGSAESLRALTPLTNQLADKFKENIGSMAGSAGTMDAAFDGMASTGKAKLQLLNNKLGEVSDAIQSTFGNALPYLNFGSQMLISISSVAQLGVALKSLGVSLNVVSTSAAALGRAKVSAVAVTRLMTAALRGEAVGATTAAVATRALGAAVKGLLISTGVGMAIVALSEAIGTLMEKSDAAAESADGLTEAEMRAQDAHRQEAEEISRVRTEMDQNIAKLKGFKGSKEEEKKLVEEMNTAYGGAMGYYQSVSQWYNALTANSKAYCEQMVNEIKLRKLANEVAELDAQAEDIKKDENGKTRKYSKTRPQKQVKAQKGDLGAYLVGGVYYKNVDAGESDWEKAQGRLNAVNGERAKKRREMEQLVVKTPDYKKEDGWSASRAAANVDGRRGNAAARVKPQAEAQPLEGSIDYYEKEIEALKKRIGATADEGAAAALQQEVQAKEQALKALKVRIGVEAPEKEETKTALEQLQEQLNAAQREMDNEVTVEGKVEAWVKVAALQQEIDEATRGKLSIEAEAEPGYVAKGSKEDKRQSYGNAQQKASRIQSDYEMGLIDADEAKREIADVNKEIAGLGDGLKPIKIGVETEDVDKAKAKMKGATDAVGEMGNSLGSLGDAIGVPELNVAGTLAQAIATMVAGYATATTQAATLGPWAWIAFAAAGLGQLAAMIASVKQMGAFAEGGIVGGNSKTGDRLTVRVNSGEMILNAQQQARLFALANGASVYGQAAAVGSGWKSWTADTGTEAPVHVERLVVDAAGVKEGGGWRVRGRDLVRAIANETRSTGRRSGIRI